MTGKDATDRNRFLRALDRIDRLILTLFYVEQLTPDEIGLVLDVPIMRVQESLRRMREMAATQITAASNHALDNAVV